MSGQTRTFRRPDTGETRAFAPGSYRIDTTTQRSSHREHYDSHFYRDADGYRIDPKQDGSFRDKWGVIWEPV